MRSRNTARISLVVWRWQREKVEKLAAAAGLSVNAYLRNIIDGLPEPKKGEK